MSVDFHVSDIGVNLEFGLLLFQLPLLLQFFPLISDLVIAVNALAKGVCLPISVGAVRGVRTSAVHVVTIVAHATTESDAVTVFTLSCKLNRLFGSCPASFRTFPMSLAVVLPDH